AQGEARARAAAAYAGRAHAQAQTVAGRCSRARRRCKADEAALTDAGVASTRAVEGSVALLFGVGWCVGSVDVLHGSPVRGKVAVALRSVDAVVCAVGVLSVLVRIGRRAAVRVGRATVVPTAGAAGAELTRCVAAAARGVPEQGERKQGPARAARAGA